MRRNRKTMFGASALAAALFLSACGGSDDANDSAAPGETPVVGGDLIDLATFSTGQPLHLDPAQLTDIYGTQFSGLVFDGLTAIDSEGEAVPAVAEKFSSNDDATVWTFDLRDDVEFTDGTPVLPSDFKRGWQRVLDPALEAEPSYLLAGLQSSEDDIALDNVVANDEERTLTVTLSATDRDLPALLSLVPFSPIPESVSEGTNLDNTKMVGNGPFVMDGPVVQGEPIRLSRNDNYYGGPGGHDAYLDSIEFRVTSDESAAYNDFAAGNGQVGSFPAAATADLQQFQSEDIISNSNLGVEIWGFNMTDPDVGGPENLKLRQAIDLATNKRKINDDAYGGARQIASQFSSPNTPGSDAVEADGEPDVEGARRLLSEWGGTPPEILVSFNTGSAHEPKAQEIAADLQAVGIPARINGVDLDAYRAGLSDGAIAFFRYSWIADFPAYRAMLEPVFSSGAIGASNYFNYDNPAVDELFTKAQDQSSADSRNELYREAEKLIMADQPFVPLSWQTSTYIKAPEVRNFNVDSSGLIAYDSVWMNQES